MDPNANLTEQRWLVGRIRVLQHAPATEDLVATAHRVAALAQYAIQLADLVESLDAWVTAGGFLPGAWTANRA